MGIPLQVIIKHLEELAPLQRAQKWDNSGLQVGDGRSSINSVLVALEVSEEVVEEAINKEVGLIVAHHPLIFTEFKSLVWPDDPLAALLRSIIHANINVYVAHTNLDSSPYGSSALVADMLELCDRQPLTPISTKSYKLVVFVPRDEADNVRLALGDVGAGVIGDYSHCAFQVNGTGFFHAGASTSPCVGEPGKLSSVNEVRLETIVAGEILGRVIKTLLAVHPYEEVAYDLYPLDSVRSEYGVGITGDLLGSLTLAQLADKLSDIFKLKGLRWVGDAERTIEKVAICGGSGADLVDEAKKTGAQVLISGDFKYHQARQAQMLGLAVIDIGHFACEYFAMQKLADKLRNWFEAENQPINIITCQSEADPFNFLLK